MRFWYCITAVFIASSGVACADNIRIGLKNFTSFNYVFDIYDNVCNREFPIEIRAGDTEYVSVCSSGTTDDGYASINFKKSGNTSWTQRNQLSDGQVVNIN